MNKFKIAIFTITIIIFSLIGIKKLIHIKILFMSKNKLYIPLKVVPYIFISITAITITAATYVIT